MATPYPTFKDRFHTTGADMREAAVDPAAGSARLTLLGNELAADGSRLRDLSFGDIQPLLLAVPTPAQRRVATLAAHGYYAIGLIRDFADDADTYDQTVKALNERHSLLVADRIHALRHEPDLQREPVDRAAVADGVTSQLDPEYLAARQRLSDSITRTGARFDAGLDEDVAKSMIIRGLIPLAAAGLYPTITLTNVERALANLAAGIPVPLPPGTPPREVLQWWNSLEPAARTRLIEEIPEFVGNTDGIPAADRDTANRARLPTLIEEAKEYVEEHPDDDAAAEDLAGLETLQAILYGDGTTGAKPDYQLLLLDDTDHPLKAALSNGPVDEADIVTTWIGGTTSTVEGFSGDLVRLNNQSREVQLQLDANGDPRQQVGVLWLGYDAPDHIVDPGRQEEALDMAKQSWKGFLLPGDQDYLQDAVDILLRDGGDTQDAINTTFAKEGAPVLANFAEGIEATNPDATQTASAHSYGGAVLGGATQETDAYDTIVTSGTPGLQTSDRDDLQADHVYISEAQWSDQDYSGVIGPNGRPNVDRIIDILKDGGDFVPDIGKVDDRFGADPSDLSGVRVFDNSGATVDDRDLSAAHGHSSYWDEDSRSLYNEANAIIGRHDKVGTR